MSRSCSGDAPLEEQHQQHVDHRLGEEARLPLLLGIDAHDLVADVLVLADDVRVGVVQVVVGVLPRRRGRGRVPVPGRGVDVRVVHPVPLAVEDVVADLHVLEDLRRPTGRPSRAATPADSARPSARSARAPRGGGGTGSCCGCSAASRVAEVGADLVADRLERLADLVDLLRREAVQRVAGVGAGVGAVDGWAWSAPHSSISMCPSGALTQVRMVWPGSPWSSPVRRSRTCPTAACPCRCGRSPAGSRTAAARPACSPPTRIETPTSQVASTSVTRKLTVPPRADLGVAACR